MGSSVQKDSAGQIAPEVGQRASGGHGSPRAENWVAANVSNGMGSISGAIGDQGYPSRSLGSDGTGSSGTAIEGNSGSESTT